MNKATIKQTISEANTNKEIKWGVAENTAEKIVLTNSYDKGVKFTIKIGAGFITVRDNLIGNAVEYFFKGDSRFDDYANDDDGVKRAIKAAVIYFNRTY